MLFLSALNLLKNSISAYLNLLFAMSHIDLELQLATPYKRTHPELKNDYPSPHSHKHADIHSSTTIASETDLMSNTAIIQTASLPSARSSKALSKTPGTARGMPLLTGLSPVANFSKETHCSRIKGLIQNKRTTQQKWKEAVLT